MLSTGGPVGVPLGAFFAFLFLLLEFDGNAVSMSDVMVASDSVSVS